ncbi:hypothetical protein BD770DRAFT_412849 [Pilaira anomala]|nr:hypothetical protein BD770DRAFT_412849 [Pilaira anomala]
MKKAKEFTIQELKMKRTFTLLDAYEQENNSIAEAIASDWAESSQKKGQLNEMSHIVRSVSATYSAHYDHQEKMWLCYGTFTSWVNKQKMADPVSTRPDLVFFSDHGEIGVNANVTKTVIATDESTLVNKEHLLPTVSYSTIVRYHN